MVVFGAKRGIQDMEIFQALGQQLGTLMPRPQNPWAVRGEQFLFLRLGACVMLLLSRQATPQRVRYTRGQSKQMPLSSHRPTPTAAQNANSESMS
jgi:hypothetical protein